MIYTEKPDSFENPLEIVGSFVEYDGKILLLHRQDNKSEGGTYGPPGGKVDKEDADLAHAIARELFEETGLKVAPEKFEFIKSFFVKYSDRNFVYHQFKTIFDALPAVTIAEKEHKGYVWTTPAEALKMPLIHDEDFCIQYVYGVQ